MAESKMKRFHGTLPEESFAIVQEVASRMGMSVKSFVSMSAVKYALKLKREFEKSSGTKTLYLSQEDSEYFTQLMEDPAKYFGKANAEFRRLKKHIDIKA